MKIYFILTILLSLASLAHASDHDFMDLCPNQRQLYINAKTLDIDTKRALLHLLLKKHHHELYQPAEIPENLHTMTKHEWRDFCYAFMCGELVEVRLPASHPLTLCQTKLTTLEQRLRELKDIHEDANVSAPTEDQKDD